MTDALERLKQRNRPVVPSRDVSLTAVPVRPDISDSSALAHQLSINSEIQQSNSQENEQLLQTKQSTLRLEVGISDRLQYLCQDNKICREVLIEAMLEHCEASLETLQAVLRDAKAKNEHRQQIANQKRAKSMMQRFGSNT